MIFYGSKRNIEIFIGFTRIKKLFFPEKIVRSRLSLTLLSSFAWVNGVRAACRRNKTPLFSHEAFFMSIERLGYLLHPPIARVGAQHRLMDNLG